MKRGAITPLFLGDIVTSGSILPLFCKLDNDDADEE